MIQNFLEAGRVAHWWAESKVEKVLADLKSCKKWLNLIANMQKKSKWSNKAQTSPPLFETRSHQVVCVPEEKTLHHNNSVDIYMCIYVHHRLTVIIVLAINCYQLQPAVAACQAWPLLPQDDQSRSSDLASRPPAVVCGVWNMLVMSLNLFMFDYKRVPLASSIVHKMSRFFLFKYILLPALPTLPMQIQPLLNRPKLSS